MCAAEERPLVVIRSLVYNHEPYLRDCLEGFVMQQATFPFVAVVHDDCSTDGSAAIIREYAEKYPHIIKPVYETENQYSKRDGSLRRIMDEACGKYGAKYYALCEGDDCWTDPHKLQKQVDFLEAHPDYTMTFCNGVIELPNGRIETDEDYHRLGWPHIDETREATTEEMILDQGVMVLTAGMLYRNGLMDDYPAACRKCHSGDATLQAMAAIKGKVHYFHDSMIVYRYQTPGSWTYRYDRKDTEALIKPWTTAFDMYESLDEYSHYKYTGYFHHTKQTMASYQVWKNPHLRKPLLKAFGRHLLYKTLKDHLPKPQGLKAKLWFMLQRICFFPYYPIPRNHVLLLPVLRSLYKADKKRRTIHIGRYGLLSLVEQVDGSDAVYVLGKRVR